MSKSTMTDVLSGCGCAACQEAAANPQAINSNPNPGDVGTLAGAAELLSGYAWNSTDISYKFFKSTPAYYQSGMDEQNNFQEFNGQMKAATLRVLDQLETFTNITFTSTGNDASAQLGFGSASLPSNVGAWAYYPHSSSFGGDVWTNNVHANTQNPAEGNFGFYVLMHEIGHALGLRHSFEGLSGAEATSQFSVMAYDWSPYFSSSYMLYDIKSLQDLYGANNSYNTGNNNYVLKTNEAYTVWDAGGNDTFDAAHVGTDVVLNLNQGAYSTVGLLNNIAIAFGVTIENARGGAGDDTITGNDIANILEGGAGNDTFYGSSGNDTIDGEAGDDLVIYDVSLESFLVNIIDSLTLSFSHNGGSYGLDTISNVENFLFNGASYGFNALVDLFTEEEPDDVVTINGTSGADIIHGGDEDNIINGLQGSDRLYGNGGNDIIYGSNGQDRLYGGQGDDELHGEFGANRLYGNAGDDILYGGIHNDLLDGGLDNDELHGGKGADKLYGNAGNDILHGGNYNDVLYGGAGNDILHGDVGNDKLFGNYGNDILYAEGAGTIMHGGGHNDTFVITNGATNVVIQDFSTDDLLDISDILTGYSSGDDINDFLNVTYSNGNHTLFVNADGVAGGQYNYAGLLKGLDQHSADDFVNEGLLILV